MSHNTGTSCRRMTLLIGFSQIYAWATTYYIPAAILSIVSQDTGQNAMAIVGGFSWALLVSGLAAPKIGQWIEDKGGRYPLALGSFLMGLGLLVLATTHHLLTWYLGWTLAGLGMGLGLFNAAFAAIGRLFGQEGKKIIIHITLISGFATLFWPLTTYLIQTMGWRTMLVLYAMPHFIIWLPLFLIFIPKKVPEHEASAADDAKVVTKKVRLVFFLLVMYAILRAIVGTTISVDILALLQGLGLTIAAAAVTASFIGPAQIVGRILEMYIGSNFSPLNSGIFWTAVLPVAIFVLLIFGATTSLLFAIAYGMSNGVLSITMGLLPMILFGAKGYASLLGKLALPVLVAQSLTPLLIEPMLKAWPATYIFMITGVLGIAALLCLIGLAKVSQHKDNIHATA